MNKMTGGGGVNQAPMSMGMRGGGIFGRRGEVLSRGAKDYSIYRTPSGTSIPLFKVIYITDFFFNCM